VVARRDLPMRRMVTEATTSLALLAMMRTKWWSWRMAELVMMLEMG